MSRDDERDIGDDDIQREAARFILRRLAIWTIPLVIVGILLAALGVPLWITVPALLFALAMVVFELDI